MIERRESGDELIQLMLSEVRHRQGVEPPQSPAGDVEAPRVVLVSNWASALAR